MDSCYNIVKSGGAQCLEGDTNCKKDIRGQGEYEKNNVTVVRYH